MAIDDIVAWHRGGSEKAAIDGDGNLTNAGTTTTSGAITSASLTTGAIAASSIGASSGSLPATTEVELQKGLDVDTYAAFYDDFVADVGATIPVPWVKNLQTANMTGDYISGAGFGVYRFLSSSDSEGQSGNLTTGDCLMINMSNNPILEVRARLTPAGAALTADERMVIGLGSAHANAEDALDNVTTNAWFRIEGASMSILVEADDGTTDTDDQDTTYTAVKGAWTVFKIDASDLSDVKFYVDGTEQLGDPVSMADLGANTYVQPIVCIQRDAGAEVNSLDIDYIKVLVER